MKKQFQLFAIAILMQYSVFSQTTSQRQIDSLKLELSKAKQDSTKLHLMLSMMAVYERFKPEEGLSYQKVALEIAGKSNQKINVGRVKDKIGRMYWQMGKFSEAYKYHFDALDIYSEAGNNYARNYVLIEIGQDYLNDTKFDEAEKYLLKALKLSGETGDQVNILKTYDKLIALYQNTGNFAEASKVVYANLKISEETGDKTEIAHATDLLAENFQAQGNNEEALQYFKKGLQLNIALDDKLEETALYRSIGDIYLNKGNYKEAENSYKAGIKVADSMENSAQVLTYLNRGIGNVYRAEGNYLLALDYLLKSAESLRAVASNHALASVYSEIGIVYTRLHQYEMAGIYLDSSMALCKLLNTKIPFVSYFSGKQLLDSATGNWKDAYEDFRQYTFIKDSIFNKETFEKMAMERSQYENEKKEAIAKAMEVKKDALVSLELSRQKIIRNFSITGVLVILILGVYLYYDFQRRKKLEGLQALSDERLRISRELHDDIGSTLGSIAVYSDVAKNRSQKNEDPGEALSKIGVASRELIEKMSDIVWSLNPDNESFEQLQNRMEAFAAMILTARNIAFEFKTVGELKTVALTNEQRRNIFMIYKEAMHNILKYADCRNVVIAISRLGNILSIAVEDDGIGFDTIALEQGRGHAYNGNGLKNMKARAGEMNAVFAVASEIGKGTSVEVKIKM